MCWQIAGPCDYTKTFISNDVAQKRLGQDVAAFWRQFSKRLLFLFERGRPATFATVGTGQRGAAILRGFREETIFDFNNEPCHSCHRKRFLGNVIGESDSHFYGFMVQFL